MSSTYIALPSLALSGPITVVGPIAVTQSTSPWIIAGTVAATQSGIWSVTANQGGAPWSQNLTQVGGSSVTLGQKTMNNSIPIVRASDQTPEVAATSTTSNVSVTTSSTQLLASNTNRKGAMFYNDGGGFIFIKFGTGATATSFTVRTTDNSYYEIPYPIYTGEITAVTTSGTRTMRVTELT